MTIASYVKDKMGAKSYREIEKATVDATGVKISRSTLNLIVTGATDKPQPDTLAVLAATFAAGDEEKRKLYYAEMMTLCGYLDLLPEAKANIPSPYVNEREILDRLPPEVRAYADGLRVRNLDEYWEFLEAYAAQKPQPTRHDNPR